MANTRNLSHASPAPDHGSDAPSDEPVPSGSARLPDEIMWLSSQEAAHRLGLTPRTLYRLIDEGQVPAYRFGRVIRLQQTEVDEFIQRSRIQPGSLEHLYPEPVNSTSDTR
jgi:excisionase family DNA binding protein